MGLFSVPLAKRFAHVLAVESNPAASRDLESNARTSSGIEIRTADVEQFLAKYKGKPDLIVLDPPRAGLAPGDTKQLLRISPARITYVSCEPPTLARDLAALTSGGYEIAAIHLFDLFPADISHGDGGSPTPRVVKLTMKLPALWIAASFAAGIAIAHALAGAVEAVAGRSLSRPC